MSWADVPTKYAQYVAEPYADENAGPKLLAFFKAETLADVPVLRRAEFEEMLDYRLGACVNLRGSVAINPKAFK